MALSNHELACVYAALILADADVDVSEQKLSALLNAANYKIEDVWTGLFASALKDIKINDLIKSVGAAPAAGAAAPAASAATTTAAAPADNKPAAAAGKKEEKPVENDGSDEEMGFGLFD